MKKKIKDLTEKEIEIICSHNNCLSCPLAIKLGYYNNPICLKQANEKEVEIDE